LKFSFKPKSLYFLLEPDVHNNGKRLCYVYHAVAIAAGVLPNRRMPAANIIITFCV